MYIDAKVNDHSIKLIFDNGSANSIITQQLMDQLGCQVDHAASTRIIITDEVIKTPIGKIDDFPFEEKKKDAPEKDATTKEITSG
ncbi:hypothetical protein G9A89_009955 [Geosiphon pyriformis]|nr:hypothetical protein G9A89_009955 [Geosiphon pyriformis]